MVISDVYKSFIPNKSTVTKYYLIQWISKLLGSFQIHRVRQFILNFTGLAGIVNATVYKTMAISTGLGHGKLRTPYSLIILWNSRHICSFNCLLTCYCTLPKLDHSEANPFRTGPAYILNQIMNDDLSPADQELQTLIQRYRCFHANFFGYQVPI